MSASKSANWSLVVAMLMAAFTASTARADVVRSASELIDFFQGIPSQELPAPTSATRGLESGRGVAGVRQGNGRAEGSSSSGVAGQVALPEAGRPAARPSGGVDFHNIVFDSGSFSIPSESYRQLDEIGMALAVLSDSFPDMQFIIEGHTDSLGGALANRELSFNRANAIRRYLLVKHDIAPGHLEAIGMGESQPLSSNATRQGRALNRRVSIKNNR